MFLKYGANWSSLNHSPTTSNYYNNNNSNSQHNIKYQACYLGTVECLIILCEWLKIFLAFERTFNVIIHCTTKVVKSLSPKNSIFYNFCILLCVSKMLTTYSTHPRFESIQSFSAVSKQVLSTKKPLILICQSSTKQGEEVSNQLVISGAFSRYFLQELVRNKGELKGW